MKITVNSQETLGNIHNFWNNCHFHPTDAVEDTWGRKILDQIATDNVAQYVRLYAMFEDIVTRNEAGELVFDFSEQDKRFDYMVNKNYKILLCFNFMPKCMAKNPNTLSARRYKNKFFCRSNPKDYNEWKLVCKTQTEHLIERYGINIIKDWYFHCWNEPDLPFWIYPKFFFECTDEEKEEKIVEYCKLYDAFASGVNEVTTEIKIGGPSCGHYKEFFERVIEHVSKNNIRFDFASTHCYSSIPQDVHDPERYTVRPENIVAQYNAYRSIMEKHGFGDKEIIIDEWAAAAEGYLGIEEDKNMIFRESEYYSAFYAKMIDLFLNNSKKPPKKMMICLSGQDYNIKDFDGHRTFFTAHKYRKPIYNAFALCAKLGDKKLSFESDQKLPKEVGILPTISSDNSIKILLYNLTSSITSRGENIKLNLKIDGLTNSYKVKHYRIDNSHSNAFSRWANLCCPQFPSVWERNEIAEAGELSLYYPETKQIGDFTEDIILTPNSVSLVEISFN